MAYGASKVPIHQRYDWNRVVERQPFAILIGLFQVLSLHGGGWVLRVKCSDGTGAALEFLFKFGCAIALVEFLHWFAWRLSTGRKAPSADISEQDEVPFTGGHLLLVPKKVQLRFLLWVALIVWSFYALDSIGPCEPPKILSFTGSIALLVFAYTSLLTGTFIDFYPKPGGG